MLKTRDLSAFQQLILLFILILSSWFLMAITGSMLGIIIWDYETVSNLDIALKQPTYLKYIQIVQSLGLFIIPPILFTFLTGNNTFQWLKITTPKIALLILSSLLVIIAQPFISFSGVFNAKLHFPDSLSAIEEWMRTKEDIATQTTLIFLRSTNWLQIIINILIIAIIPAIGEELLFRGSLQKILILNTKKTHLSIFVTAFLFSALHMQFFGFLPRFLLGIIFGYLFLYGNNIWLPITAHFINNITAFIYYQHTINKGTDSISPLMANKDYPNMALVSISLIGVILTIFFLRKQIAKDKVIAP